MVSLPWWTRSAFMPCISRVLAIHWCGTESNAFFTSTQEQGRFFLWKWASPYIILSISRLSTVPIDFILPPLWSICIRLYLSSCTGSWWSITDVMSLYRVFKQFIGQWSEADGSSLFRIITLLPIISQAGISSLSVSMVFRAVVMSPPMVSIFFIQ